MVDKVALLQDRLFVNHKLVTQEHTDAYTVRWTNRYTEVQTGEPKQCAYCQWWQRKWKDRSGKPQMCHLMGYAEGDSCNEFEHRKVTIEEPVVIESFAERGNVIAFARGDLGKLQRTFHDFEFMDERVAPPLEYPLEFTSTLRDYQQEPVDEWLQHGYGILKGPTACGKSVMLAYIIAKLGVRTLLLSHERRHLQVLIERLYEHTNLELLETKHDAWILGSFAQGEGDFPITLATFQSFHSKKGQSVIDRYKHKYGLVWVDECHHTAAMTFHHVFSSFNSFWRGGTTATPTRKDKMHLAVYNSLGPVTSEAKREMRQCEVTWVRTGLVVPHSFWRYGPWGFSKMQKWLSHNDEYLQLQLDLILKDIEDGRKVLIIHERLHAAHWLKRNLIAAGYNVEMIVGGSAWKPFEEISQSLTDGVLHCIIGSKVMNENIDIPPLDCLHLPAPSTNPEMEEQRAGRIRRPFPSYENDQKPTPLIRAYCFEGPKGATVPEHVRRQVYTRLGFIDPGTAVTTRIVPLAKEMNQCE